MVRACRFSADGKQILSGSDDRSWKSWRLDNYRETLVLKDETQPILDAHFSPSGDMIATAHGDGTVGLWNPKSGERTAVLIDGHEYLTNKARINRDETRLATAAGDNTLRLWDLQRGTQIAIMEHAGRDGVFTLSQSGSRLVAGGDELGVAIWNLESPAEPLRIRKWSPPTAEKETGSSVSPVTAVAVSNDGKYVVVGDKTGTVEFWDAERGTNISKVFGHSETVVACYFLPTESNANINGTAITVSSDGSVAWWDGISGNALERERLRHFSAVQLATLSSDGKYLASCASLDDKRTRLWIWDLKAGEKLTSKDLEGLLIQDMVFTPGDLPTVFVTTSNPVDSQKKIWQWNGRSNDWQATGYAGMTPDSLLGAVPTGADSNLLTYGGRGARLWRMKDGKEIMSFRPSSSLLSISLDSKGKLLATASDDGTAMIWDVTKQSSVQKLVGGHSGAIRDLVFSSDDQSVITSGADGRIVVWDVSKGTPISSGRISESKVVGHSLCNSPDGKVIAIGCDDNSIRLYDSGTLQQTNKLLGHAAAVNCLSFSLDGRYIVSGSQDQTIRVWSISSEAEIGKLLGHSAPLASVVFSSDGLRVLSASQDTTVRLWDIGRMTQSSSDTHPRDARESNESLGEVLSLEFHASETTVAEFSPDGRTILTAGVDGKAVLWPSERIPPAIRVSNPNLTYQIQDGQIRIDANAVLCQPGTMDLNGAKVEIKLEGGEGNCGQLTVDTSDGLFSIKDQELFYHPANRQPVAIATTNDGTELRFLLSSLATHTSVEELIRHVAFQGNEQSGESTDESCDVVISIVDREGRSGNYHPERVRISRMVKSN
jgi:WD40 repeat protein